MPGEHLEDAVAAAARLQDAGMSAMLTKLGENVTATEAEAVTDHYLHAIDLVAETGLDAHISVKPTQLGLDLDASLCARHLHRLLDRAEERRNFVLIDMESSRYVDPTPSFPRGPRALAARGRGSKRMRRPISRRCCRSPAIRSSRRTEPPTWRSEEPDVDTAYYAGRRVGRERAHPDRHHDRQLIDRLGGHQ
jgi:hypothetical protein